MWLVWRAQSRCVASILSFRNIFDPVVDDRWHLFCGVLILVVFFGRVSSNSCLRRRANMMVAYANLMYLFEFRMLWSSFVFSPELNGSVQVAYKLDHQEKKRYAVRRVQSLVSREDMPVSTLLIAVRVSGKYNWLSVTSDNGIDFGGLHILMKQCFPPKTSYIMMAHVNLVYLFEYRML
jgi:hypothetical protein